MLAALIAALTLAAAPEPVPMPPAHPAAPAARDTTKAGASAPGPAAGPGAAPVSGPTRAVPADTTTRIPGTSLRFGLPVARVSALGGFTAVASPEGAGTLALHGTMRCFGLDAGATLIFRDGVLARAQFAADSVSEAAGAYVEDQLMREGYRRACTRYEPGAHVCDWEARATMHVEILGAALKADARAPVAPAEAPAAIAHAMPAAGATPTHATTPEPAAGPKPAPPPAARPRAATPDTVWLTTPATDTLPRPVVLDSCRAQRPAKARAAGVYGRVRVLVLVDTTGAVIATRVAKGVPLLDTAALACARRWRFQPYVVGGRAVRVWVPIAIGFAR